MALLSCSKLTAQSSGHEIKLQGTHSDHISLLHKMTVTMMPSAAKPAGCFKRSNELVTILCLCMCLNSMVLSLFISFIKYIMSIHVFEQSRAFHSFVSFIKDKVSDDDVVPHLFYNYNTILEITITFQFEQLMLFNLNFLGNHQ